MWSTWFVEAVDVSAKGPFSGGACMEAGAQDQLILDRLEHRFDHGIIYAIALSAHRRNDAVRLQQSLVAVGAILTAAIGMMVRAKWRLMHDDRLP